MSLLLLFRAGRKFVQRIIASGRRIVKMPLHIFLAGIASEEKVGTPVVELIIMAGGIASAEDVGSAFATLGREDRSKAIEYEYDEILTLLMAA